MAQTIRCPDCGGVACYHNGQIHCPDCPANEANSRVEPLSPPTIPAQQPSIILAEAIQSPPREGRSSPRGRVQAQPRTLHPMVISGIGLGGAVLVVLIAIAFNLGGESSSTLAHGRWQAVVLAELASTERDFEIVRWYPPEPVIGAEDYRSRHWFPIERQLHVEMSFGEETTNFRLSEDELGKCHAIRVKYTYNIAPDDIETDSISAGERSKLTPRSIDGASAQSLDARYLTGREKPS